MNPNVRFRRILFSQKCVEEREKITTFTPGVPHFFRCTSERGGLLVDSPGPVPSEDSLDDLNERAFGGQRSLNYLNYLHRSDEFSEILSATFSTYFEGGGRIGNIITLSEENDAAKIITIQIWFGRSIFLITMCLICCFLVYCYGLKAGQGVLSKCRNIEFKNSEEISSLGDDISFSGIYSLASITYTKNSDTNEFENNDTLVELREKDWEEGGND